MCRYENSRCERRIRPDLRIPSRGSLEKFSVHHHVLSRRYFLKLCAACTVKRGWFPAPCRRQKLFQEAYRSRYPGDKILMVERKGLNYGDFMKGELITMARFDPFQEMDRLSQAVFGGRQGPMLMPMDLYREGDHYVLNADLPGIDPNSVDVDVDGQLLSIRAERTLKGNGETQWMLRERQSGSFLRQLTLGQDIDVEGIAARYDNGVLSVTIPVSEGSRRRKIDVVAGQRQEAIEESAQQEKSET